MLFIPAIYGVTTSYLKRQVRRNVERFPDDFMFQLDADEFELLRCQIGISKGRGGRRHAPFAFTEQGVAMLSSVLCRPHDFPVVTLVPRVDLLPIVAYIPSRPRW